MQTLKSLVYSVDVNPNLNTVVFINGIIARNLKGILWLWLNLFRMRKEVHSAKGCIQLKAGVLNWREVIMVSYWENTDALNAFFKSTYHASLMRYLYRHPAHLSLYNETYFPEKPGKYINEPNGMALTAENVMV